MDITGAIASRLRQQSIDHADDRGVVFRLKQVLDLRDILQ